MRDIPVNLEAHLQQETITLAHLVYIQRADGVEKFFTDAVRDVEYDGDVYVADGSFSSSAVFTSSINIELQSVSLEFILSDAGISEADIRSRLYLQAACQIMGVNYASPADGVLVLYAGSVGKIQITNNNRAILEISAKGGAASGGVIGSEVFSMTCRANLGDARCGVDIDALAVNFEVDAVGSPRFNMRSDDLTQDLDTWRQGKVVWATGANQGTTSEVNGSYPDGTVRFVGTVADMEVGDTGVIYPGCDKLIDQGCTRYDNVVNFRGEPHVPTSLVYNLAPYTVKV